MGGPSGAAPLEPSLEEGFLELLRPHLLCRSGPWVAHARCARLPAEEFFRCFYPAPGDAQALAAARACCRACPVMLPCLGNAVALRERSGVRGGATRELRYAMARALGVSRPRAKAVAPGRSG